MLERHAHIGGRKRAHHLEHLIHQRRVGRALELQQVANRVQARLRERLDSRPSGLNRGHAELFELLQRHPRHIARGLEAGCQLPLRRQTLPGPVLPTQHLFPQGPGDVLGPGRSAHVIW
jgi:hypothetical protein